MLDGLRALAIVLVIASHVMNHFWLDLSKPIAWWALNNLFIFLMNGWCGVDLFFVLSGFLITRQILAGDTVGYFYKKRFMRIAPMYYVVLTLTCLGLFPDYPVFEPGHVWGWRYIYHLLFLQDFLWCDIVPIFWSLAVEFHFYVLAPFLLAGLIRIPTGYRYASLAAAAAASIALKTWVAFHFYPEGISLPVYLWRLRVLFPLQLDGFIVGIAIAFLRADSSAFRHIERPAAANALFGCGVALLIALTGFSVRFHVNISRFDMVLLNALLAPAFGLMMLGLLGGCRGHKVFTAKSLRYIALISYSLYLLHLPLISVSLRSSFALSADTHPLVALLVFVLPYMFLNILLASMTYWFIEKPCIDWSKSRNPERPVR